MRLFTGTVGRLALLPFVFFSTAHAANLDDPTFRTELDRATSHAVAFSAVCVGPAGQLLKGPVQPKRLVDGLPLDTIDCTAEWKYTYGLQYTVGNLLTYPTSSYLSWEDYRWHRDPYTEPHPQTFAEAWNSIVQVRAQIGAPAWTPEFGRPRCLTELRFGATELPLPHFTALTAPPAVPPVLKTVSFMTSLNSTLASAISCSDQRAKIAALFAQASVTDPRDWAWISWAARHPALLFGERMVRLYIGGQSQMAHLHPKRDHDRFSTESFLGPVLNSDQAQTSLISFNLAVAGTEKDALDAIAPGKGFAQFSGLSRADQERWLERVAFEASGLTSLFTDSSERQERGTRFRKTCDKTLAQIFGGPAEVVAGSGFEIPFPGDSAQPVDFPRWHVFSNLHIYDGSRGDPLFVPAGLSALSGGQDENACFATYYRRFGAYGATRLVSCHLSHGAITRQTNLAGSVAIGQIGGPGGSGDGGYSHSHLILYSSDMTVRLNFVDAFCR